MAVLRGFRDAGIVACFHEMQGGGGIYDLNAPRNAPAANPSANLSDVIWHSEFGQYELAMPEQVKTINHPAVSGRTRQYGIHYRDGFDESDVGVNMSVAGRIATAEHTLVTHNLGYPPKVFAVYENHMLTTGEIVQRSDNRNRSVCLFVTNTIVGLREIGYSDSNSLSAVTRTYRVLVFRDQAQDPGAPLFDGPNPVRFSKGKIASDKSYLRKAGAGSSAYVLNQGPTLDVRNGRVRLATGGVIIDEAGYNGSMAAPQYKNVGL